MQCICDAIDYNMYSLMQRDHAFRANVTKICCAGLLPPFSMLSPLQPSRYSIVSLLRWCWVAPRCNQVPKSDAQCTCRFVKCETYELCLQCCVLQTTMISRRLRGTFFVTQRWYCNQYGDIQLATRRCSKPDHSQSVAWSQAQNDKVRGNLPDFGPDCYTDAQPAESDESSDSPSWLQLLQLAS